MKLDPYPLGLNRSEWAAISGAHHAISLVPNRHFLCNPNKVAIKAAEAMISRGFLTLVEYLQPVGWIVVKMTDENIEAYNTAVKAHEPVVGGAP